MTSEYGRAVPTGFGKSAPNQSYQALFTSAIIGGVHGIFRSDDAGTTWVQINDSLHQYGSTTSAITGDPNIYGRVYVGTNGQGIVYGDISGSATPTPTPTSGSPNYVRIIGQQSGKCVDVQNPNTQPGANADIWTCNGNPWQNWQFNDLHNGYFTVVSQNSSLCLDVTGASKAAGAHVEQWTCNGGANQAWSYATNGSYHTIVNQNSGLCLDVTGQGTADGTQLEQWTCNGGANQNWSQQ